MSNRTKGGFDDLNPTDQDEIATAYSTTDASEPALPEDPLEFLSEIPPDRLHTDVEAEGD